MFTQSPYIRAAEASKAKCIPAAEINWENIGAYVKSSAPHYLQRNYSQIYGHKYLGSGSSSRGWRIVAPQRYERQQLLQTCGKMCFLNPSNLSFPICGKLDISSPSTRCLPYRQGLTSAYARAKQWHHERIAKDAQDIRQHLCTRKLSSEELSDYLTKLEEFK